MWSWAEQMGKRSRGLRGLVDRVFFVDLEQSAAAPASPSAPPRIAYMDFSFLTLEDMVRERRIPPDSMLNIMTLRKFKDAIDDEWPQYADKIHRTAENVISQRMGRRDSVAREADDTYIFCFYSLGTQDARHQVETITSDLMTVLVGDRYKGIKLAVGEAPLHAVLDESGAIDRGKVNAVIDAAVVVPWPDDTAAPRDRRDDWLPPGDLEFVSDDDAEEPPEQDGPAAARGIDWTPLVWPPTDERRRRPVDLPLDALEYRLPDGLELGYWPAWDARREVVDTYVATALATDPDGRRQSYTASGNDASVRDVALLFATLEQIQRNIEARHRLHMVVPIGFNTLILPGLATVKAILRHFPDAARARHLIIEITDVPQRPNPKDLGALRRLLSALCRDTIVRLGVHGPSRSAIETLGPGAVSLQRCRSLREPMPDGAAFANGRRLCFWGIDDKSMLAPAIRAQPWLVGGDAVGPIAAKPRDIELLPRRMMLAAASAV